MLHANSIANLLMLFLQLCPLMHYLVLPYASVRYCNVNVSEPSVF